MGDRRVSYRELDLGAIRGAEFCPPAPPRQDAPARLPQEVGQLLKNSGSRRLSGFYTEATEVPGMQALTLLLTCSNREERAVAVLDTLTHMNKQDLTPFTLARYRIEGRELHYGRFLVEEDLRCSLAGVLTTEQELGQLDSRERWKAFFGRAEPLYPLTGTKTGEAIVEPVPLPRSDSSESTHRVHRTRLLPGLSQGEQVRADLYIPDGADKLLIVCDGQVYLEQYPLWPAISQLNRTDLATAPCAVLFLEPAGGLTREGFLGRENYLPRWLTSTALPWVATWMPQPASDRCLIAGGSLGGLAAAQTVRSIPDQIARAVVQSASFWWSYSGLPEDEGQVLQRWLDDPLPSHIEIFHEVGQHEGYLLSWNTAFHRVLTARIIRHTHRVYRGGHDYACWRQGIVDALKHFFVSPADKDDS